MTKILFAFIFCIAAEAWAQFPVYRIGLGAGTLGPPCFDCGAPSGFQSKFDIGLFKHFSCGGVFEFYTQEYNALVPNREKILFIGVTVDYYLKTRFEGFHVYPVFGFIKYDLRFGTYTESHRNYTIGVNVGYDFRLGDYLTLFLHWGYGNWYEGTNGWIAGGAGLAVRFPRQETAR